MDPHYEFEPNDIEPYWEPADQEEQLKAQLNTLRIAKVSEQKLEYVVKLYTIIKQTNHSKKPLVDTTCSIIITTVMSSLSACRLLEQLGSGEFGVVRKGIWSVGGKEREVAVKSLADGSTEEKRIKFLQEAAIMGQFKHPNVVGLLGISEHNSNVSYVLTYL